MFAEPGSTQTTCKTIQNETRLGVWHNWLNASRYALDQDCEFVLSAQDDARFHPDCKSLIESIQWPSDAGCVSLYTPSHYQLDSRNQPRRLGLYPIRTSSMWGAVALCFRKETLQEIIEHKKAENWYGVRTKTLKDWPAMKRKRMEQPWLIQNSDTRIGQIVGALNLKLYYFNPSPVEHISKFSSIGHGSNRGKRNAGAIADPKLPLALQIFKPKQHR